MHRVRQLTSQLSAAGQTSESGEVLYIANRCISALRVLRTAKRLGFRVVGGYCTSDAKESFVGALDSAVCLEDDGPSAYTNIPNVIKAAVAQGAKYVHPGIGFLSESGDFARACKQAGLIFVGPSPECLDLFGNKFQTCALATRLQVPNLSLGLVGRSGTLSPEQAAKLPVLLKATNGGGGIGLRLIHTKEEAADMYQRCVSEATRAFASSSTSSDSAEICAEIYLSRARHVEVQLAGDGQEFVCLSDRECSVQRKFQKMIEIAPCPALDPTVREGLAACALRIAKETRYQGVGTFEFLVQDEAYYFIECNPRLQVEHTVTEQIYRGLDLVAVQLRLARGLRLADALLPTSLQRASFGTAIQLRVCAEVYTPQGQVLPAPANTRIAAVNFPRGEFRVETFAKAGTVPNPKFDSLLAQIVVSAESFEQCCLRCVETLSELEVVGCPTNIALLKLIVQKPQFLHSQFTTSLVDRSLSTWLASVPPPSSSNSKNNSDSDDESQPPSSFELIKGQSLLLLSPMQANVVAISVAPGDTIIANRTVVAVLSALKMEHEIRCTRSGVVDKVITCAAGAAVDAGATLCEIILKEVQVDQLREAVVDNTKSPLFQQFYDKVKYFTQDASRPDKTGARVKDPKRLTARQVLAEMFDVQAVEYGRLASNGYQKHSVADGLYLVRGAINQKVLGAERPHAMVMAYDYTVLAGTQGLIGHRKSDRVLELMLRERFPIVLFAEGGGGRAGDAKSGGFTVSGLDGPTFTLFAKLSVANVPLIGAVSGFCFAGNAALLGTCDLIIATKLGSVGMGGPAMIEGGGLGVVKPEEVGPTQMHFARGVIDVLVDDDVELVAMSKQVLSYFQGRVSHWNPRPESPQEIAAILRNLVPVSNRRLAFSMETAIQYVFDLDSVLMLKSGFAKNIITCFARIEGHPVGVLANDCRFVSGTLDANATAKAAGFLRLCAKHKLPVVVFCDTPGFLVGVQSEKEALLKRSGEMFIAGASLTAPVVAIIVRRCVGLGGQAMCTGDLKAPRLCVAWPTGEFGAMGIEGAVKLGFRAEIKDNPQLYEKLVAEAYENGKALHIADRYEMDDVIDPADTRSVIKHALCL